jgi:hypothetical protein
MKALILIPLSVVAALAAGAGICILAGARPPWSDVVVAAAVAIIAAEVGILPAVALRHSSPGRLAQAALGGTLLHLLLAVLLAAAAVAAGIVNSHGPFVWWLTGAYWTSLAVLVWGLLKIAPGRGMLVEPAAK